MIAQRTLSILLTGLMLAFGATTLTGCCCGDMSGLQELAEEEAKRQAEEAANTEGDDDDESGDDDDEAKGDDDETPKKAEGDDDDDSGEEDGGSAGGDFASWDEAGLKKAIKSNLKGWKVTNTTNSEGGGTKTHVLSIQKGLKFATITLQKHKTATTAKFSEKSLKKIDNTAIARDGKTVLYIFSTGKKKNSAKSILGKLVGK